MSSFFDDFLKPKIVDIKDLTNNDISVVIEPLERGFGHTVGTALRRVLLSSMPGCAIVEAKLSGVLHEFMVKDGVYDDVMDIMIKLGGICFKMHNKDNTFAGLSIGSIVVHDDDGMGPVTGDGLGNSGATGVRGVVGDERFQR